MRDIIKKNIKKNKKIMNINNKIARLKKTKLDIKFLNYLYLRFLYFKIKNV